MKTHRTRFIAQPICKVCKRGILPLDVDTYRIFGMCQKCYEEHPEIAFGQEKGGDVK